MKTKMAAILVVLISMGSFAFAGLSPEFATWADGPEGFLLTKDELKEWNVIQTDKAAKHFIDLFWAKRNPKPGAAFNEFKARFEGMVKYCDENFSYDGKRGALSDMGRVFLLMGPPHNAQNRAPTQTVSGTGGAVGAGQSDRGTDQVRAQAKLWSYDPARMDPRFKVKGTRLLFTFYEERALTNQFVLDRSHREATMSLRALKKAPEVHLLHPDLKTVPKPVSVPGGTEATEGQLAALVSSEGGPLQEQLHVMQDLGVADADHRPLWIHLGLPKDTPTIDTIAGQVLNQAGDEVLSTFQIKAQPFEAGTERAYHLTFPLAAGTYQYEIGGFIGDQLQVIEKASVEVPEVSKETWFSTVWAGLDAEQKTDALLGEAYTFGAWHLMPLAVKVAPKDSQLSYFGYIIRPVIEDGVEPTVRLKLTLKKDGKRLGKPLSMTLPIAKVANDVYMYANAINLAALPAGACSLEFKVSASGTEASTKRTVELELVE
jgi:GWxTD domain-containing protein